MDNSWKVPSMWEGGEVWILGGGPSLPRQFGVPEDVIKKVYSGDLTPGAYSEYMQAIHEKHVIGINMAFKIGNWIDMVFFGDNKFYLQSRQDIAKFPGLKVTCHTNFKNTNHNEKIKYLQKDKSKPKGITEHRGKVSWNANSGAAAISVAANAGAKRIILVGFDMTLDEGNNQHWHKFYQVKGSKPRDEKKLPFNRHLSGFEQIAKDAKKKGIEIINASPSSKITQFKKVSVKELI